MFKNIGKKIKTLAKIICIAGISFFVIFGLVMLLVSIEDSRYIVIGILYLLFGPIFSWICSFTLYGFGELIDNSKKSLDVQKQILEKIGEKQVANKKVWKCSKCGFDVSNDYSYCPFCQYTAKDNKQPNSEFFKIEIPTDNNEN